MKEVVMCSKNLKSTQSQQTIRVYWSTVILTLPFLEGGGGGGSDSYLKFDF